MILDAALLFSGSVAPNNVLTGQSLVGTGNILSQNTVDIAPLLNGGNQAGDFGIGESLNIAFAIGTGVTGGTSIRFQLIQADDAALTTGVQVINQTDDIPVALLTAGTLVPLGWDSAAPYPSKRYIGCRYVIAGTTTAGTVSAAVVKDLQFRQQAYKSGYVVQ